VTGSKSTGLSIGYRIAYRLKMIGLTLFGPAQLGESNDPKARLVAERQARVARVARARAQRGHEGD
jgi:hypothetical protein